MSTSVYTINKGINRPVEFRGFKAQYIWYLGGGLILLLIVFAFMYIIGINTFICLGLILLLGVGLFTKIYQLSHTYGEHGMMKMLAQKSIPRVIKARTRKCFVQLKKS